MNLKKKKNMAGSQVVFTAIPLWVFAKSTSEFGPTSEFTTLWRFVWISFKSNNLDSAQVSLSVFWLPCRQKYHPDNSLYEVFLSSCSNILFIRSCVSHERWTSVHPCLRTTEPFEDPFRPDHDAVTYELIQTRVFVHSLSLLLHQLAWNMLLPSNSK